MSRLSLPACLIASALAVSTLYAAPPYAADERAAVAGQPAGHRGRAGIGHADGSTRRPATGRHRQVRRRHRPRPHGGRDAVAEPAGVVDVQDGLFLRPKKNGAATLVISAGGKEARVPRHGRGDGQARAGQLPPRRDRRALNVGGCNAGACHGTPSGKNGFKLSLRGFDPAADLPATHPRPVRPPHRQARPRRRASCFLKARRPRAARGRPAVRRDQRARRDDARVARRGAAGRPADAAGDQEGRSAARRAAAEGARPSGSNSRWSRRSPMARPAT